VRSLSTHLSVLFLFAFAGWWGWTHYHLEIMQMVHLAPKPAVRVLGERFHCDTRKFCAEMTSCDEARYFLQNCPLSDLNRDGETDCEKRWCDGEGGRLIDLFTK